MTEARQHHIVPKCYLKGFTHNGAKNSKLFVVDLSDARSFDSSPHNVAKRRDFNRIEGLPAGELENRLSKFEAEIPKALDRIAGARSLDDQAAWITVVNLIALLAVRTPRRRESFRQAYEQMCKIIMDLTLASPERWAGQIRQMKEAGALNNDPAVSYEQVKKFHEAGQYRVEAPTAMHLWLEFGALDKLIAMLLARRWLLCVAPADSGGLITSDHPVCLMHSDMTAPALQQPLGFGLTETTVIFPLTRELLAIGTFEGAGGVRPITAFQVANFNSVIASFAERQVYAADNRFRFTTADDGKVIFGADLPAYLRDDARKGKQQSEPA